jgi:2-octaprenyl-6-methoxyphenol hydroxylase
MDKQNLDVLIIGGGLVGLSLAKGLEKLNVTYHLLDERIASNPFSNNLRTLALSKTSLAILSYLGLYENLIQNSTPIQKIHVSCEHEFGVTELDNPQHDFLGMVINLFELQEIIFNSIEKKENLIQGTFKAYCAKTKTVEAHIEGKAVFFNPKIIIAADGAHSSVRTMTPLSVELGIQQTGLLSVLHLAEPHHGLAFERFTQKGPFALLPWREKDMALVWGMSKKDAHKIHSNNLLAEIQTQLGERLGEIDNLDAVKTYPLYQVFMPKQSYQNILFLGNAAHTLHPVAGQGFNLSLRDVAVFLDMIRQYGTSEVIFPLYLHHRQKDQRLTKVVTRFLASNIQKLRQFLPGISGLGLGVIDSVPTFKDILAYYAQGLGYSLPHWVYEQMDILHE